MGMGITSPGCCGCIYPTPAAPWLCLGGAGSITVTWYYHKRPFIEIDGEFHFDIGGPVEVTLHRNEAGTAYSSDCMPSPPGFGWCTGDGFNADCYYTVTLPCYPNSGAHANLQFIFFDNSLGDEGCVIEGRSLASTFIGEEADPPVMWYRSVACDDPLCNSLQTEYPVMVSA